MELIGEIINAIFFILPAYIANVTALIFGGGLPLDFGVHFIDKKRLIGDGVTWKGTLAGTFFGTLTGFVEGLLVGEVMHRTTLGFLLGFGALLGDAFGSFIKRRLGIERGKPAPILDQLDFVAGALLLGSIVTLPPAEVILFVIIITIILHIFTNIIAYILKIKDVWY